MSLFGTTPPEEGVINPSMHSSFARSRHGIFDDDGVLSRTNSDSLFNDEDDGSGSGSPWDIPVLRKQKSRAELLRSLLPAGDVPEAYVDAFDAVVQDGPEKSKVLADGVTKVLSVSKLSADDQAEIMGIVSPGGPGNTIALGRSEFNVFLALIGLAQEGETASLDSVDERRKSKLLALSHPEPLSGLPLPQLPGLFVAAAPPTDASPGKSSPSPPSAAQVAFSSPVKSSPPATGKTPMDFPSEDPWNAPDLHKRHQHSTSDALPFLPAAASSSTPPAGPSERNGSFGSTASDKTVATATATSAHLRTTSNFTTTPEPSMVGAGTTTAVPQHDRSTDPTGAGGGGWETIGADGVNAGFGGSLSSTAGVGYDGTDHRNAGSGPGGGLHVSRTVGNGRTGDAIQENVVVTLMPEKEGLFMFQHHNYEVTSSRRGSKVVRRYSDFVWLLECLHKRYPFRVLPLLPPKRVAVNGNHLSNDGAFIEKRRRGLARFLDFLVRHPVLCTEQLVVMFMTVPTELSVWRKQASISVQDEFANCPLPPGLEESLSPQLSDMFDRTRAGVRRSAELYIMACNIMDRLVKRSEGVANDHARLALTLQSMTEVSADTYATDTNDVPLLNDGLVAMSKHLHTGQTLMEDEAKAWDAGVLEDLKRQRDALVGLRDLFDRRERFDRDNIPALERRIQKNETKLAMLRQKPEGLVKPEEIDKVVQAIIKDKESIVTQHNRSVFVKECIRDELIYFQATQYHVSRWSQDWAQERVKYAEMLADNWRRLLDELDGMPLGD